MSTLHDRLAALADDAPLASPPPPDLWRTGKRRARRRRAVVAGAALAAVTVLAAGTGAVATLVQQRADAPVLDSGRGPAVPDQLFTGSSWLPHGSADGGGGPLASAYEELRSTWGGSRRDLLAVSAVDQSYRWLDLPGFEDRPATVAGAGWALAPDGRHLAYWTQADPGLRLVTVDTVTGARSGHTVADVDAASTLAWTGDVVWACPGRRCAGDALRVDARTGRATEVRNAAVAFGATYVPGADGTVTSTVQHGGSAVRVHRFGADGLAAGARPTEVPYTVGDVAAPVDAAATSPDGSQLVVLRLGRLRVGPVAPGGEATTTAEVPTASSFLGLERWLDATHVLARTQQALVSVDVTTGAERPVVELPEALQPEVATALLDGPTVPAVAPPDPVDPRQVATLAGLGCTTGVVLAAVLWLLVRRRRAQR